MYILISSIGVLSIILQGKMEEMDSYFTHRVNLLNFFLLKFKSSEMMVIKSIRYLQTRQGSRFSWLKDHLSTQSLQRESNYLKGKGYERAFCRCSDR